MPSVAPCRCCKKSPTAPWRLVCAQQEGRHHKRDVVRCLPAFLRFAYLKNLGYDQVAMKRLALKFHLEEAIVSDPRGDEKGFKWWARYALIPLIVTLIGYFTAAKSSQKPEQNSIPGSAPSDRPEPPSRKCSPDFSDVRVSGGDIKVDIRCQGNEQR